MTLISVQKLCKSYPGVIALDQVDFSVEAGEVHAIVGENGAGKSTLMKILSGLQEQDSGSILLEGQPVRFKNPAQAQGHGIGMVHQELNLVEHLTVSQNVFLGREAKSFKGIFLDEKKMSTDTQELLDWLHVAIDPSDLVGPLSIAHQQLVEITKALSFKPRILIMDEPTAALNDEEVFELFKVIRKLRDEGVSIVYISHKMEEIRTISDRITVLRDGKNIGTVDCSTDIDTIIEMMVGRKLAKADCHENAAASGTTILKVRGLTIKGSIEDISLDLCEGEILGLAGLMGSGRSEIARAVFGADSIDSGEVFIHGEKVTIRSPEDALAAGIGYLPEDRKVLGLALDMTVESNVTLSSVKRLLKWSFFLDRVSMNDLTQGQVNQLRIKTPSIMQKVRFLSGGNQQKIVIAKWLLSKCQILIFDEPTRGIDIGAKSEIYALLKEIAQEGKGIIVISSELPELLRLSDRIAVVCEGRISGQLTKTEATQERIMRLAVAKKPHQETKDNL